MSKNTFVMVTFCLAIGIGLGVGLENRIGEWFSDERQPETTLTELEKKPLFYRNPMNPEITSPVPAKDYMGMDYIPVYADQQQTEVAGTVKIDPVVMHNIGVRTAIAQNAAISKTIRAMGRVGFDEESMTRLHPKTEGWIEEMWVNKTGQEVAEDDMLLSIYSPKLVASQQEYLLALKNLAMLKESPIEEIRRGAQELVHSSRARLELLDVPRHQIEELDRTRKMNKYLHIHSPRAGTVIRIGSRQGQFVTPKTELYMMVNLDQVWVYADIYEFELPWVKVGDEVEMTLVSVPGKTFKGSLAYIYPYAESKTRTTKVRLIFDNHERLLRPDMFAEVSIQSGTRENSVVIPAEAVIRSGKKPQVFIVRGSGKFEPRTVVLGVESGGNVAVLEGIQVGDEVVVSSQFLVDSESKLREAASKMMEPATDGQSKQQTGEIQGTDHGKHHHD